MIVVKSKEGNVAIWSETRTKCKSARSSLRLSECRVLRNTELM